MNQLAVTLVCLLLPAAFAFPSNRYKIPNGLRIPCPEGAYGCRDGICNGFGHTSCFGASELNPFGEDMRKNGHTWTKELCEKDSDGDGLTNGEELGDPCCLWSAWDTPSDYMSNFVPSHPGFSTSSVANYVKPSCDSTTPKRQAPVLGEFNPGEEQRIADVRVKNYTIPYPGSVSNRTHYVDIAWNFDDDSHDEFHVIAADGIVATPKNLHHYVVRGCQGKFSEEQNGRPISSREEAEQKCQTRFGGWAPGGRIQVLPPWAGLPIGRKWGFQSFVVNIHYDNPDHESGIVSQDGMRIFYTPTLRNESMAAFSTMQLSFNPSIVVPAQTRRYFITRECDLNIVEDETTSNEGNHPEVQIMTVGFHAHLLGTEMYAERIRAGERLTLAAENIWHFDDQFTKNVWLENWTLRTGDKLQTTCIFDSRQRSRGTTIGIETTDEMCWATIDLGRGGVRARCNGPLWTGTLEQDEPALGLELRHPPEDAEGVWDGTDLRNGGAPLRQSARQMCVNMRLLSQFCPRLAEGQVDSDPEVCNMNYSQMGYPSRIGGMRPIQSCCDDFCTLVCPNHESCPPGMGDTRTVGMAGNPTTSMTTTTTTTVDDAFEPTSGTASVAESMALLFFVWLSSLP